MTEQKKTALTKREKEAIKDSRESGIMSEEEFARVQGMTASEIRSESTGFRDWIERSEKE